MGDNQEILFAKTLEEVKKQAKKQQNCIAEAQVREAFGSLSLSEEQLALVFDYLKKHKIGIGEPVDADEYLRRKSAAIWKNTKKMFCRRSRSAAERKRLLSSLPWPGGLRPGRG